jgi:hypothetical protein
MWRYGQGGTEPTLDEIIHEPVIRLMMERDRVTEEALLRVITIARQRRPREPLGRRRSVAAEASDGLLVRFGTCVRPVN